jgi:2-methylisocitrate lyase-like PEP mutase family enzyme
MTTTGTTQAERARAFRALHEREGAFSIPNPWDAGSARLLAHAGFEALATTSAGFAFSLGRRDYAPGRASVLAHLESLVAATLLPVSADLENAFGDDAKTVAETFRLAAATGIAGGSVEDSTGRPDAPIYELAHAAERVRAGVETVRALPFPFTLTARAENFLHGRPDLGDTIRRLEAYQEAGADVLYAPGLARAEDIAAVVRAVDRPVNVLAEVPGLELDLAGLARLGVKRVSIGGALARAAYGAVMRAATEMRERGSFAFAREAPRGREIAQAFEA